MHFSALFLLCASLAVGSESAADQVRSRSFRRAISLVLDLPGLQQPTYTQPRYYHRLQAAGLEQPAEVNVPVPDVHAAVPQEKNVHQPPIEDEQKYLSHEIEILPSKSEEPVGTLELPVEHEELPILEEPAVHESAPKSEDLSVLYDYLYPMVLRKCLASAISSSMGSNSEDDNVNYNHQMKYIDHPLVQISGLDTLEELRRNLTAVAAARQRFSRLPKMTSGCVFHFNEIDADMQAAREDLLMSQAETLSEGKFRLDNKYILKYERLFQKDFMMHIIIRKLYELLRNHTSIYDVILALDADLEKYIKYWNTK